MTIIETGELSSQECKTPGCSEKTNTYYDTELKQICAREYGANCDCFYNYLMAYKSPKQKEIEDTLTLFDF